MNGRPGNAWYQKFAPWGDTSPQKVDQDEALGYGILDYTRIMMPVLSQSL